MCDGIVEADIYRPRKEARQATYAAERRKLLALAKQKAFMLGKTVGKVGR